MKTEPSKVTKIIVDKIHGGRKKDSKFWQSEFEKKPNELQGKIKNKADATTGWILLIIAWGFFITPIPFTGYIGMVINGAALILAVVILIKGNTTQGVLQLISGTFISGIIYMIGIGIFIVGISETLKKYQDKSDQTNIEYIKRDNSLKAYKPYIPPPKQYTPPPKYSYQPKTTYSKNKDKQEKIYSWKDASGKQHYTNIANGMDRNNVKETSLPELANLKKNNQKNETKKILKYIVYLNDGGRVECKDITKNENIIILQTSSGMLMNLDQAKIEKIEKYKTVNNKIRMTKWKP